MDPAEGLGSVLRLRAPAECAVASGMLRAPAAPSSAGDRRILWVFHENSPQVPRRRDAGEPELGSAACSILRDLGGSACIQGNWWKLRGAGPWMELQYWD